MKQIITFAVILAIPVRAMAYSGTTGANGYCLYKGDGRNCAWCVAGGTQPGNCVVGYAMCTEDVATSNLNETVVITSSNETTTWRCTSDGWTYSTSTSVTCDRYSYKNSRGECKMCPYPDFVVADGDVEVLPHGDNWEYKLTGCNIMVEANKEYKDASGIFIFTETAMCQHSGIL